MPDWPNRVTPSGWVATQMDMGKAATDMTSRMRASTLQADGSMKVEPTFDVEHVASMVVYVSNLPVDTNAQTVSNCKAERFRLDERLERWSISTPTTSFDSL